MLLYWLVAAAMGAEHYGQAQRCLSAPLTQCLLAAWTLAFYYHLCNGVRHLFWDAGRGFELATAYRSAYAVLAVAAGMTILTWACVFAQGGAA